MQADFYSEFEREFRRWAQDRPEVEAAVVVGSRARATPPPDPLSDLDIIVYLEEAHLFAEDRTWFEQFGDVWAALAGWTGRGDPEWMVVYAGGYKVDFVLVTLSAKELPGGGLEKLAAATPYRFVFERGARLLYHRQQPAREGERLPFAPAQASRPTPEELDEALSRFWMATLRADRLLRRGELWQAARQLNGPVQDELLGLATWQATARSGGLIDTWYGGRNLASWSDPRTVERLQDGYARCEKADLRRALLAQIALGVDLAQQIAELLEFPDLTEKYQPIADWIVKQR